jgi:hypothetical protein
VPWQRRNRKKTAEANARTNVTLNRTSSPGTVRPLAAEPPTLS